MKCPDGEVLVATVDEDGRLKQLCIAASAVHVAREQGWMVWDDFEAPTASPQADGDDGA
jgi:hypothetical protein